MSKSDGSEEQDPLMHDRQEWQTTGRTAGEALKQCFSQSRVQCSESQTRDVANNASKKM